MLLEIEGLSSHYGRIQALSDVSISVGEGELVALVGANGAGKTTLLRCVSGIQPVSAGRILLDGQDITKASPQKRVRLGISQVPEGRQVFGPLSVEDNLLLGTVRRRGKDVKHDLERMYTRFPALREKRKQPAGTLSGGQQQMLALCRALMSQPRVMLLDEPSMGLAPMLAGEIFDSIEILKEQGTTIFLVEQNAFAALGIANRGYVLETGSMVLSDTGIDLLRNERVKSAYLGV